MTQHPLTEDAGGLIHIPPTTTRDG